MIEKLYSFTEGTFVVASEWNANFKALSDSATACQKAISDANNVLAFEDSDLSAVYARINNDSNSFNVPGLAQTIAVDCEYWKNLAAGEQLTINVPTGLNGEARVIIRTNQDDILPPIIVRYKGQNVDISGGMSQWYKKGIKFVFIYEGNGKAYAKMIKAGV